MPKKQMLPNVVEWNGDINLNVYKFKWMLTDWCNYNCSYCAVKTEMRDEWSKEDSPSPYKLVLSRLERFDGQFNIELFGGEPTLHPNIDEILLRLKTMPNRKNVDIITNLSRPIAYFEKLNSLAIPNLTVDASLHCDYYTPKFLEKINQINQMENIKITVTVNMVNDRKHWPMIFNVINQLKEWDVVCSLHFLYDMPFWQANYDQEFYDTFVPLQQEMTNIFKYKFGFSDGSVAELSPLEIYEHKYGEFKGFECTANFYDIDYAGTFKNTCTSTKVKPMLFKSEDLNKPIICPNERCGCPVMYGTYKRRIHA